MEKCWFVLRQTHYPAPEYKFPGMAFGEAEGPLRLGHFISSPKAIDGVINAGGIVPFPRGMRIWCTKAVDFRFSHKTEKGIELSGKAGAPIAAAAGVTINAEAGVVFKRTMGEGWIIDRLETQIVQPTLSYIEQCHQSSEVSAWVQKNKTLGAWKMYMISGLMIARGAKKERSQETEIGEETGPAIDVPALVTAEVKTNIVNKKEIDVTGQYENDFVWAIRLTEVSKGILGSEISHKTLKRGALFAPGSNNVDIEAILSEEGFISVHTSEIHADNEQQYLVTLDGY